LAVLKYLNNMVMNMPIFEGGGIMGRVEGKVAVVTGGALGLGKATCQVLAKEGATIAVTDIRTEEGQQLAQEMESSNGAARFWELDTSNEEQVRKVFTEVRKTFGKIDVLVNNAGISGANKPTHELTLEEWERVMAVKVQGVFLCTKHVIPYMQEAGGGSIINLSSIYGLVGAPDSPPYHASKGAVRLMSKTDAMLYAKAKIRVNSVHPGFIWTPMVENFLREQGSLEEGRRQLDSLHPIGYVGEPDDIAYGILYLASDEAKFVTGSELVIDGGYTAR
jgi:NAD(P)-dependent dehydrogenase (short-subunit alcohol dehydrogenase family)